MGIEAGEWLTIYGHTHNGTDRIEWPDGGCYQEQLQIVVELWGIIRDAIHDYREEKRAK